MDSPDMCSQSSWIGEEIMTKFTLMFSDSFMVKLYMILQALPSNLFPTIFTFNLGPVDKLDVIREDGLPGKHLPTLIALGSIIFLLPLVNTSNVFP